ncbi:hypothetical protein TrCOL_g4802 [Triparma columacea]|uniref:Uncharacterized protein n=1 Tax=Triparma columacea TaxID=722753 RepID=A0A9W7FYQ1_9STRA|nr:hypothetical protein TrCOL_g4802 [Triparma columacea]
MAHSTITLTSPNGIPTPIILYPSIALNELVAVLKTTFPPPHPAMLPVGVKDTARDIYYPLQILTSIPKYFEGKTYELQWSKADKELEEEQETALATRGGPRNKMLVSPNVVHRVMNLFRKVATPGPTPSVTLPQYTSIIHHMFPPTHTPNHPYITKLISLYNLYDSGRGYCTAREILILPSSPSGAPKSSSRFFFDNSLFFCAVEKSRLKTVEKSVDPLSCRYVPNQGWAQDLRFQCQHSDYPGLDIRVELNGAKFMRQLESCFPFLQSEARVAAGDSDNGEDDLQETLK